jgi:hypothetical protein
LRLEIRHAKQSVFQYRVVVFTRWQTNIKQPSNFHNANITQKSHTAKLSFNYLRQSCVFINRIVANAIAFKPVRLGLVLHDNRAVLLIAFFAL